MISNKKFFIYNHEFGRQILIYYVNLYALYKIIIEIIIKKTGV